MTYANNADQDQSLIWIYTVCHSTKYFKKEQHKNKNLGKKSME